MDATVTPNTEAAAVVPGPRLLVVDDNPDNLDLLCRLCRRHGYEVFSATTGMDTLRLAVELKPDLLLLDVQLPDLNGRAVCRAIKNNPTLEGTFIALVSSVEVSVDNTVGGLTCGADEYITRPIANQELVARVGALLRIQQALTARRLAEARLAQLNQTLEQRVADRTGELAAANEQMRREIAERRLAQTRSEAFARLGARLSSTVTPRAAAEIILETAGQLLGWDACFLQLYSPATARLSPVLAFDTVRGARVEVTTTFSQPRPSPLMRRILRQGGELILRKPGKRLPRTFSPFGESSRASASLLFAPIHHGGVVAGVVSIQSYTPGCYTPAALETLQALAAHAGGALERLAAEAARQAGEDRFRAFMEHAPHYAWIKDDQFRYVYLNPHCLDYSKLTADRVQGLTDFALFSPVTARRIRAGDDTVLRENRATEVYESIADRGQKERSLWIRRFPITDAAGRRYLAGMAVDITEKVRAEAERRALPQRILAAQEGERRRVARELHDGVSQLLASVRFRMLAVEGSLHDHADGTLRREVSRAKDHLETAAREVRNISHHLLPRELDDLGLHAAIHTAVDPLCGSPGLRIQCRLAPLPARLPAEVELALYRIFQEALTNILKHAQAKHVTVTLSRGKGGITLRLTDDGRGFASARPQSRTRRASLGILNMRERAESIQGTLTVRSAPREGTTIEAWVPSPKSPEKTTL